MGDEEVDLAREVLEGYPRRFVLEGRIFNGNDLRDLLGDLEQYLHGVHQAGPRSIAKNNYRQVHLIRERLEAGHDEFRPIHRPEGEVGNGHDEKPVRAGGLGVARAFDQLARAQPGNADDHRQMTWDFITGDLGDADSLLGGQRFELAGVAADHQAADVKGREPAQVLAVALLIDAVVRKHRHVRRRQNFFKFFEGRHGSFPFLAICLDSPGTVRALGGR